MQREAERGELEKALKCQEESLAIKMASLGAKHLSVGMTLGNIGAIYEQRGELEKALKCCQTVLKKCSASKELYGRRQDLFSSLR